MDPGTQSILRAISGRFHEAKIVSYSDLVHGFEHFHPPLVSHDTQIAIGKMPFV